MTDKIEVIQEDLKLFEVHIHYRTHVSHVVSAGSHKEAVQKALQEPLDKTQAARNCHRNDSSGEYPIMIDEIGVHIEDSDPAKKNIVYLDIETQLSSEDLGGWFHDKMRLSVGCIYQSGNAMHYAFEERDVHQLIGILKKADLVVGFNLRDFDYRVLKAYTDFDMQSLPTWDMMTHVRLDLGRRVSLANIAKGLCLEKAGHGLEAVQWFKDGDIERIKEYCMQDVDITREIFKRACERGWLAFWDEKSESIKEINTTDWKSAVNNMLRSRKESNDRVYVF